MEMTDLQKQIMKYADRSYSFGCIFSRTLENGGVWYYKYVTHQHYLCLTTWEIEKFIGDSELERIGHPFDKWRLDYIFDTELENHRKKGSGLGIEQTRSDLELIKHNYEDLKRRFDDNPILKTQTVFERPQQLQMRLWICVETLPSNMPSYWKK